MLFIASEKSSFYQMGLYEGLLLQSDIPFYPPYIYQAPQWNKSGDYFVQFSLYRKVPSGQTTTGTQITTLP